MGCHAKTRKKIMQSVLRKHPKYSLKRRKKIVNSIMYRIRK